MINWNEIFYGQMKYSKTTPWQALFEIDMMRIFHETGKSMGWFFQEESDTHITYHYGEFGNDFRKRVDHLLKHGVRSYTRTNF